MTVEEAFSKAIAAHKAGQLQQASEIYGAILKVQPRHPDVNHNLGVIATSFGHTNKAEPFFRIAIEMVPKNTQYWVSYFNALFDSGKLSEAKQVLIEAEDKVASQEVIDHMKKRLSSLKGSTSETKNNQNPSQSELKPVINFYAQSDLIETLSYANKLLAQFPESEILYNMIGIVKRGLGEYSDSIICFKKAIEIKPDFSEAHNGLGNALKDAGDFDTAINSFEKALEIKKNYPEAYYNMSLVLHEQGRLEDAIKNFKKALKLEKNYADAYNGLGNVLKDTGDLNASLDAFRQAIKIKADFAEAHFNLGNVLQSLEKFDDAVKSYEESVKYKPDFPQAFLNMGISLFKSGDYQGAKKAHESALNIDPSLDKLELSKVYQMLGQYEKAVEVLLKRIN